MTPSTTASSGRSSFHRPDWWRNATVYQVYPRSFADGNGDGVGDLQGVLAHLDHFEQLGVDAVWFSPFYPSALADGGYDVDDYRDIDPTIGTLAEFDEVIRQLHAREIRVIIDIVPNHSSDRHRWFQAALSAGRGSAERDRYIFREGTGDNGELPPSDWQSFFGGSAWERVKDGQWYLHLFTPQQPDWNWSNPEVRSDFVRTLKFWGDRGVDGFRVDVAMGLAKDMSEPLPAWSEITPGFAPILGGGTGMDTYRFAEGKNPVYDRDEVHEIYAEWRTVFDTYDPPLFAVAEAWVEPHRRARYASANGLGQAFNFDLLESPWDAAHFGEIIRQNLELAEESGSSSTWVYSNHDVVRHATRYMPSGADGPDSARARRVGLDRARAATMLALALPGCTYIYQGEELGLPQVRDIPREAWQDPWALRGGPSIIESRDGCRVPLPWIHDAPFFGFSASSAHLPQPGWFREYSVDIESQEDDSTLRLYRDALRVRRELTAAGPLTWEDSAPGIVAFRRGPRWMSITNFGDTPVELPAGHVALTSRRSGDRALPPNVTAWIVQNGG